MLPNLGRSPLYRDATYSVARIVDIFNVGFASRLVQDLRGTQDDWRVRMQIYEVNTLIISLQRLSSHRLTSSFRINYKVCACHCLLRRIIYLERRERNASNRKLRLFAVTNPALISFLSLAGEGNAEYDTRAASRNHKITSLVILHGYLKDSGLLNSARSRSHFRWNTSLRECFIKSGWLNGFIGSMLFCLCVANLSLRSPWMVPWENPSYDFSDREKLAWFALRFAPLLTERRKCQWIVLEW